MTAMTRRCAAVLCAVFLLLTAPLLSGCSGGSDPSVSDPVAAADNADRLSYLAELGWEVDPEPLEALTLQLPRELGEAYGDYLKLQDRQGYTFSQCGGKTVSRYTYTVNNYPDYGGPVQIDLWVCGGLLAGGDVTAPGENGFVAPLTYPG